MVALDGAGAPVGQASCSWVPCEPACRLIGLGDVAVAPAHRRRKVAARACALATAEAWRLHASAVLAKTTLLRTVLGDLGFEPSANGPFFYVENGRQRTHPDWMAAVRTALPSRVRLEEGDF